MAVCRECFWQEPSGCVLSKEPWCRSKESLLSRWFQSVAVEGADPSGESFPAHQIPSFITAVWKHVLHIIQQKSSAAMTEHGHGTDHPSHTGSTVTASAWLGHFPTPEHSAWAVINWERGEIWCPAEQHHALARSLLAGTFHCYHFARVPFPISRLCAASRCIKIQHCPTTPAGCAISSTDETDACLSNLSPCSWIPTGSHSELA